MTEQVYEAAPEPRSASVGAGRAAIQRVLDRAVAEGGVTGILVEVRAGQESWFGSAGVADTETRRERLAKDRFRIGSTTKTFVATVVLQLAAEHMLSLDDTVEKWLPGVVHGNSNDGGKITVRQLLNHTSGVFSYTQDQEALDRCAQDQEALGGYHGYTPEQLVHIAMAHPPTFEPGTNWEYSNTNYILAGMIIERVTGRALADEVSQRIARPLGLTGTDLPRGDEPAIPGPHSRHYTKLNLPDPDATVHDVTEMDTSPYWAAGSMISTAEDLHLFFSALLDGRLLPPSQQREMLTMVSTRDWIPHTSYGLGVSSVTLPCGVTVWGMGGAMFGSWSYTYGTHDGTHMLVTNVNSDWANGPWNDPIGVFTDVLQAEFCPDGAQTS